MSNWHDATDGWRSTGTEVRCPKCGDMGAQIETVIHGKTATSFFCNTCSHDWTQRRDVREVR